MADHKEFIEGEVTPLIQDSPLVSRGIGRDKGKKACCITLSRREWLGLLNLLEDFAVSDSEYLRVRALVLWDEKIRHQLAEQGF